MREKSTRKLSKEELMQAQENRRLDDVQRKALARLCRSQRFRAKVEKLTSMARPVVTEADFEDTPDPDGPRLNNLHPVVT